MKVIYKWQALKIKIVRQICSAKEDEEADPPSIPTWLVSQYCKKMKPGIPSEDSLWVLQEALEAYNSSRVVAVSNGLDASCWCAGESATRTWH